MHFSTLGFIATAVTAASAATIQVAVGKDGLTYTPSDIKASVGDSIEFSFFPKNHTVTQSSFALPCHPLASGGFFSAFVPTTSSPSLTTFTITVNDTKPIWFYCGQTTGNHCQSGMVGSINAPSTGNTLTAFVALAKNATTSTSPSDAGAVGGVLKVGSASNATGASTTKTVTTTVTALVTTGASSYTTTYGTTYTTALALSTIVPVSSSTSTSSSALSTQTKAGGAAMAQAQVGGGVFGAAAIVAWALL